MSCRPRRGVLFTLLPRSEDHGISDSVLTTEHCVHTTDWQGRDLKCEVSAGSILLAWSRAARGG
eukprot:1184526-Prymnesium_polylepis.1